MKEDDFNDLLGKEFSELERHEPSMRFAKNVVEQVKAETTILKPQRDPLYWIPRLCIAGFGLVFLTFALILLLNSTDIKLTDLATENRQQVVAILGIGVAVPTYLLLDRFFRRFMLH